MTYSELSSSAVRQHDYAPDDHRRHDQASARAAVRRPARTTSILQVSAGFSYGTGWMRPRGARRAGSIQLTGGDRPRRHGPRATSNFLADGGGGFTVFQEGTDRPVET